MLGRYCESVEEHQNDDQPVKRHRFDGQAALPAAESVPAAPAPTAGRRGVKSRSTTLIGVAWLRKYIWGSRRIRVHFSSSQATEVLSNFLLSSSKQTDHWWKHTFDENAMKCWTLLIRLRNKTKTITWRTGQYKATWTQLSKSICDDQDTHLYWPELWLWNFLTERQKNWVYKLQRHNTTTMHSNKTQPQPEALGPEQSENGDLYTEEFIYNGINIRYSMFHSICNICSFCVNA